MLGSIQGRSGDHFDWVQKKAAKFENHMNESVWETLAQCSKIASICTLFKVYTDEWIWKGTGDGLQGPCYLSREDNDWKIRSRAQRKDIG